jgi:hypothetical protein
MRVALKNSHSGIVNPVRDARADDIPLRGREPRHKKQKRASEKSIQAFANAPGENLDPVPRVRRACVVLAHASPDMRIPCVRLLHGFLKSKLRSYDFSEKLPDMIDPHSDSLDAEFRSGFSTNCTPRSFSFRWTG